MKFWILVHTYARLKLKSEAVKTYLSYFWWLLEPALFVAGFYVVFAIILDMRTTDFIVFLVCGKIPYLWFSKCINGAAGSVFAGRELLTNGSVRPELFPMVDFTQNLYKQAVALAAMLAFVIMQGHFPTTTWFLLPLVVLTQLVFMVPLALIAAWVTAMVPDARMLINILVLMLLFLSGVFWDINELASPIKEYVMLYNPLAFLIDAYRQVLLHQTAPDWWHLGMIFLFSCLACLLLFRFYAWTRSRLTNKVLYS